MTKRRRMLILFCLMAACCGAMGGVMIVFLYKASFREQEMRLTEVVHSQARIIEVIVPHEKQSWGFHCNAEANPGSAPIDYPVEKLRASHEKFRGLAALANR